MNRAEGFAVMDVSTSICEDPKFRVIQRKTPHLVVPSFVAYLGVMAESWKAGKRVPLETAWPAFLPFDPLVIDAMRDAKLVDGRGFVSPKAWRDWFEPARDRRSKSRGRWARYNEHRNGSTTLPPRGSDVDTATSVPSVPPVPSDPSGSTPSLDASTSDAHRLRVVEPMEEAG